MKSPGSDEENVLSADHSIFGINVCPFDYWKQVSLHAFAGNFGAGAGFPAGDLVDLIQENDPGLLSLFQSLSGDLLHVDERFLFVAEKSGACVAEFHGAADSFAWEKIAEHVAK